MKELRVSRQGSDIDGAEIQSHEAQAGRYRQPAGHVDARGAADPGGSPRPRPLMCTCGASRKMPYCDGTHADIGSAAAR